LIKRLSRLGKEKATIHQEFAFSLVPNKVLGIKKMPLPFDAAALLFRGQKSQIVL
jgi:hypothetical protein